MVAPRRQLWRHGGADVDLEAQHDLLEGGGGDARTTRHATIRATFQGASMLLADAVPPRLAWVRTLHQPTRGLHLNARRLLVLQVLQRYGPQLGAVLINAGFFAWTCALVLYRDSPMVWPAMLVGYPTLVFLVRLCPLCSAHHARARSLRAAGLLTTRARRQGKEIYAWILIR